MTAGELKVILIDVPDDINVVCTGEYGDRFNVTQVIKVRGLFGTSDNDLVMSTD